MCHQCAHTAGDIINAISNQIPNLIENFSYDINHPIQKNLHSLIKLSAFKNFDFGKLKFGYDFQINDRKRRFGELKRLIPAISEKMLIQELKNLVEAGILNRKAYKEIPPKVEYSLTDSGLKLLPIIEQIKNFGIELIDKNNC